MQFTGNQERALEARHHIAVTANAGSGKTLVLVERYVRILMSGVPVGEVVALTYTEKAAGELKRKIAGRISEAIATAADGNEASRLEMIRDALPAAFVGTIHSFCSRILREFPVEAGVDAAFSVMEKIDAEILLRGCATDVLREILKSAHPRVSRDQLMDVLRDLGTTRVMAILVTLAGKREQLEQLVGEGGIYSRTDVDIIAGWLEHVHEAATAALSSEELLSDLSAIVLAAGPKHRDQAAAFLDSLRRAGDPPSRAGAFAGLMDLMMNKDGSVSKRALADKSSAEPLEPRVSRIKRRRRYLDACVGFVAAGSPDTGHRRMLKTGRVILALAGSVIDEFSRRKEEEAKLDFDDLQLKMRSLLGHPGVREGLARRFQYVMVDEFQDTNALQLDILFPLLGNLASGNLFIVGDPKQSIYRFRDADVGVFEQARVAIAAAAGSDAHVVLSESFRPLRSIVSFVNLLFAHLMKPEGAAGPEQIPYDPLVRARLDDAPGMVELLLHGAIDGNDAGQEDLIARRILLLRSEGHRVFGSDGQLRPVEFRDVAVLLRSRTKLEKIEQAFIRNNVPYVISAGVGYFQTQDVYDVYNYLRFLLNTADDVALAGILRSPFFNVSDAELFRLAASARGSSLYVALTAPGGPAGAIPSLGHAARVLADDLTIGVRLPADELLARIIDRSHLRGALSGTVRGEQALANIDKLFRMARQFEAQGFNGLYDFVGRLRRLIDEEEREGQAAIESHADAVQIMTVHAAKGLEFPVVVVPDLQRPFRFDEEPFIDVDLGVGVGGGEEGSDDPPLLPYLREMAREKVREEEQRVFYVACTRARDVLLLAADTGQNRSTDSWLSWLESFVGTVGESFDRDRLVFPVESLEVPVVRLLPVQPAPPRHGALHQGRVRFLIDPLPSRQRGEVYSASKIRMYVECPSKYHLRYVLGLKAGTGPSMRAGEEDLQDTEYPSELRGRIFHAVMENVSALTPEKSTVEAAVREILAREIPLVSTSYPSLAGDVTSLALGVISSQAWREISSGTDVKTEFSISAAFEDDFITGTIDRLYRAHDGVWTVLDFKTDAISMTEAEERAGAYWSQLSFYALMVRKLFDVPLVRGRILFALFPEIELQRSFSAADLASAEKEIGSIIRQIRSGEFSPPNRPCRGCPYLPEGCKLKTSRSNPS